MENHKIITLIYSEDLQLKQVDFFVKLRLTKKYKLCMSEMLKSTCKKIKYK